MTGDRRDDCLRWLQHDGRLPSVVAAVALGGEPVWHGAAGADPVPGPATSYRIGSITKTLTAVLVLQPRDDGRLDLDDPVGRFVADTGYGDARLRELLSHTAGLQSEPVGSWWERSAGVDLEALLTRNDGRGRVASAGEFYHYSNLGFALLGEVVARLRGRSWWETVHEQLLTPLGMGETSYHPPPAAAPGWSVGHFAGTLTPEPATDTLAMAPAGQLWSTVGDLLRWADFLVVGHPDVLAADTLVEMRTEVPPAEGYGLGLRVLSVDGRTMTGHAGSMPGFQASLFVDPATRDAVAVLANATTGLPYEQVPARFLSEGPVPSVSAWLPTSVVPEEVRSLLGLWFWGNTALGFEWWDDRELLVRDLRGAEIQYRFGLRDGRLVGSDGYHRGEEVRIARRNDGTISHLECATFVYTRTPYDAGAPIPGGHPD